MFPTPSAIRSAIIEIASDGQKWSYEEVSTILAARFDLTPTSAFMKRIYSAKHALIKKGKLKNENGVVQISESSRIRNFSIVCGAIFGRNSLIGTDFGDVRIWKIKRQYISEPAEGFLIQFSISKNAVGKILTAEVDGALQTLVNESELYS